MMTARLGVASPTAATGYELDVIAAAVVGGTSLSGGEGSILGVLIGAAIMQALRNGLVLTGVSAYWLQAVQDWSSSSPSCSTNCEEPAVGSGPHCGLGTKQ